jgi:hypothetical protein
MSGMAARVVGCGRGRLCLERRRGGAGPLTLNVTFFANDTIAVTLPNGTSVRSTSGPPT